MQILTSENSKGFKFGFGYRFIEVSNLVDGYNTIIDTNAKPTKEKFDMKEAVLTLYNFGDGSKEIAVKITPEFNVIGTENKVCIAIEDEQEVTFKPIRIHEIEKAHLEELFITQGDDDEILCEARIDEYQHELENTEKVETVAVKVTADEAIEVVDTIINNTGKVLIMVDEDERLYVYGDKITDGWKVKFS